MRWVMLLLALSLLLVGCGGETSTVEKKQAEKPAADSKPSVLVPDTTWVKDDFCHKYLDDNVRSSIKQIHGISALAVVERHNPLNPNSGIESCQFFIPKHEGSDCKGALAPELKQHMEKGRCSKLILQLSFQCGDVGGRTPEDMLEFMAGEPLDAGDKALIDVNKGRVSMANVGCMIDIIVPKKPESDLSQVQKALTTVAQIVDSQYQGRTVAKSSGGLA